VKREEEKIVLGARVDKTVARIVRSPHVILSIVTGEREQVEYINGKGHGDSVRLRYVSHIGNTSN
jgi:hypothetical protein